MGTLYPKASAWAQIDNAKVLDDIRNAYERLDFPVAEARVVAALETYERFSPAELSEIHVFYALILYARNDLAESEVQLSQAIQLTPTLDLDPLVTPPQLFAVFGKLKENQQKASAQPLEPTEVRYVVLRDLRAGAAMRSMLVPGWGQLYKGEQKKGVIMTGLWATTAGGALVAHIRRNQTRDYYRASTTQAETQDRFGAFSTWHKVRNSLLAGAAGIWVYSYVDAMLRGRPDSVTLAQDAPLQLSVSPLPSATQISLRWRF